MTMKDDDRLGSAHSWWRDWHSLVLALKVAPRPGGAKQVYNGEARFDNMAAQGGGPVRSAGVLVGACTRYIRQRAIQASVTRLSTSVQLPKDTPPPSPRAARRDLHRSRGGRRHERVATGDPQPRSPSSSGAEKLSGSPSARRRRDGGQGVSTEPHPRVRSYPSGKQTEVLPSCCADLASSRLVPSVALARRRQSHW